MFPEDADIVVKVVHSDPHRPVVVSVPSAAGRRPVKADIAVSIHRILRRELREWVVQSRPTALGRSHDSGFTGVLSKLIGDPTVLEFTTLTWEVCRYQFYIPALDNDHIEPLSSVVTTLMEAHAYGKGSYLELLPDSEHFWAVQQLERIGLAECALEMCVQASPRGFPWGQSYARFQSRGEG